MPPAEPAEPPGPPPLEALIAGARFPCRDGDVLGREGTVGAAALRTVRELVLALQADAYLLASADYLR